jgi:hypothetical protein
VDASIGSPPGLARCSLLRTSNRSSRAVRLAPAARNRGTACAQGQPRVRQPSWLRERRRRRAVASGERFEEPPRHTGTAPPGGYFSIAQTLRRRREPNVRGPTAE